MPKCRSTKTRASFGSSCSIPSTTISPLSGCRNSPDSARCGLDPAHGSDDQIVPFDLGGRIVGKFLPSATIKVYDGAPHGLSLTLSFSRKSSKTSLERTRGRYCAKLIRQRAWRSARPLDETRVCGADWLLPARAGRGEGSCRMLLRRFLLLFGELLQAPLHLCWLDILDVRCNRPYVSERVL
jgi:hypothetical protein